MIELLQTLASLIQLLIPYACQSLLMGIVIGIFVNYAIKWALSKLNRCLFIRIDRIILKNNKTQEQKNLKIDELQTRFLELGEKLDKNLENNNITLKKYNKRLSIIEKLLIK